MHTNPILAVLLLVSQLFVWGCYQEQSSQKSRCDSLKSDRNDRLTGEENHHLQYQNPRTNQDPDTLITCSGVFEIAYSDRLWVTPLASGVVRSIDCNAGNYVETGTVLATLENIDFLKLQQEYLEAKSQLLYCGEEMKRQGELTLENATSMKKLQQATLAYQVWEVKFRSLAQQLTVLGFNPDSIDVDNLSPLISILAPESGHIHRIIAAKGTKINPGDRLLEMVRENKPVLLLEIPEQYYGRLWVGQKLVFNLHGDTVMFHKARLTYIDHRIENELHVVRAIAKPDKHSTDFIPGRRVRAALSVIRD